MTSPDTLESNDRIKVLFLTSMYYRPAGTYAGMAIHHQAVSLSKVGVDVKVVCPRPRIRWSRRHADEWESAESGELEVDGIGVHYVPFLNIPLAISSGLHATLLYHTVRRTVDRVQQSFPFDLIHSHRLFPTGYVGVKIARRWKVPAVVSAVGSDVHTHPHSHRGIRRRTVSTIAECAEVLAVSRAVAADIQCLSPRSQPVHVTYRGVDAEQFSPGRNVEELRAKLGLPADGIGVCTVGRLVKEKGVIELLAAFEEVVRRHPSVWLAMVGDGPLRRDLSTRAEASGIGQKVFLPGALKHEEVADWINAADIFALASYNEGLPNVVREAMACARPVVATDAGGTAEAVQDGLSGILVPPGHVAPLAAAIERLILSDTLRKEMGAAGRRIVLTKFDWEASATKIRRVYEDVLGLRKDFWS